MADTRIPPTNPLDAVTPQTKAKMLVFEYINVKHENLRYGTISFTPDDVYVVWFCKTLQNWKVLVSTTIPDSRYYEVTYNGDKRETYIDVYEKFHNFVVPD